MTNALTSPTSQLLTDRIAVYAAAATSERTRAVYRTAWQDFVEFCVDHQQSALPATVSTVARYLTTCADHDLKVATISVRLAAISKAHVLAHHPDPTQEPEIREVLLPGIRRTCQTAQVKKEPITLDVLIAMLQHIPPGLPGIRDRAILIIDFAGVFRRSELVALNVEDIRFQGNQMTIAIRRSKTDQEAQGMLKHFPLLDNADLCPLRAMRSWLEGAGLKTGPVFRPFNRWGELRSTRLTDRSIANLIKQYAQKVGLDPADYSGHSARRGGITAMLAGGAATFDVMDQSGHRRVETLREYNDQAGQGALRAVRSAFGEKE